MVARSGLMFDDFSRCESPIEALLQLAMAASSRRRVLEWCDADNIDELAACARLSQWPCVLVGAQIRIPSARARVDFAMAQRRPGGLRAGGLAMVAIECDGEQFHDGDDDAVVADRKRDQKVARLGITTLRLQGAWIALDPIKSLNTCLVKLRDTQPPFHCPPPLTAEIRQLAASWSRSRAGLSQAARGLTKPSGLVSTQSLRDAA